ncbi:MAG: hypothetical protein ACOX2O_02745 [Bdellovibrionota bacterium]
MFNYIKNLYLRISKTLLPDDLPLLLRRKVRSQLIVALGFTLLGIGNITFGHIKCTQYKDILAQTTLELTPPTETPKKFNSLIFSTSVDVTKQNKYLNRIHSRIDFYTIVVQAGATFIIIAITLLILARINVHSFSQDTLKSENVS